MLEDYDESDRSDGSDRSDDESYFEKENKPLNKMEIMEFYFMCDKYKIPFDKLLNNTPSTIICKLCNLQYTLCRCSDQLDSNQNSKYSSIKRFKIQCGECNHLNQIYKKNIIDNQIKCTSCKKILVNYCCWKCNLISEKKGIVHSNKFNYCLNTNISTKEIKEMENLKYNLNIDHQCIYCMCELKNNLNIRLPCGEIMHNECYQQLITDGGYKCPECNQSIICTKSLYEKIRIECEQTIMPFELQKKVMIRCNDCHIQMETDYHLIAMECIVCNGYNTYEIN